MNKYTFVTAVLILFAVIAFWSIVKYTVNGSKQITQTISSPVHSPNFVAPKTFKFDKSTDLKKELESVDPQVLDSDF